MILDDGRFLHFFQYRTKPALVCVCMRLLLDQVLEGISICPLLRVGRSVPDCGEMPQTQPVLHALFTAGLLLLSALVRR